MQCNQKGFLGCTPCTYAAASVSLAAYDSTSCAAVPGVSCSGGAGWRRRWGHAHWSAAFRALTLAASSCWNAASCNSSGHRRASACAALATSIVRVQVLCCCCLGRQVE